MRIRSIIVRIIIGELSENLITLIIRILEEEMTIDIICPLYNAENCIEELYHSILIQKEVYINEIRFILTESNDQTEEKLNDLGVNYTKIKKEDFSHSLTRERELKKSNADIIVFITQDIVIKSNEWLINLVNPIINGECVETYSRQIARDNGIEKYTREFNYPEESKVFSKEDIKKLGIKAFFSSDASSAIKRDVFLKIGGYDEKNFPTNEDMYITYKLLMNGYNVKYCAESVIYHSHKFTLKELYKRYYNIGVFFKENSYLNIYSMNRSGGSLAVYILKRAFQDRNFKALVRFLPDMVVRFIGMRIGKKLK